ncbi:DUF3850 domain-containing protein (plasmid) [Photobacterium sp. GJ3]|uniref:DUF3850 domain-containing protein n=1 Tax=Photobacterium sp. GJ3 TaxID=2829502 RepID=UPI001B8C0371|nr:DUF3850 domain-containing protein [Photobacterium sp. GJ3]QUJ69486.1 DUF3850 domain-containing protein [Photobacterium sp. GJ3]
MRQIKFHELIIHAAEFTDILSGRKTHQLCLNHHQYQVGDVLMVFEIDEQGEMTGQEMTSQITHVLQGGSFGLAEGWCVLSLANTTPLQGIRMIGYLRDRLQEHCDYIETQVPQIQRKGHATTDAERAVQAGRCWVDEATHFLKKFPMAEMS